jgi:hypothetical protein
MNRVVRNNLRVRLGDIVAIQVGIYCNGVRVRAIYLDIPYLALIRICIFFTWSDPFLDPDRLKSWDWHRYTMWQIW